MSHILKKIIYGILIVVFVFIAIVVRLYLVRINDISLQEKHLESLEAYYNDDYESIDEQDFLSFDLNNNDLKLNEIQMLASHNSYKKNGPAIGRFFVGLGDSFDEAKALNYGYKDITEQLELGIRSFEFDLRYRDDHFELTHVPLVDASSQAVRFDMLLDEMMLYSAHQENHMPIIVLIEVKNDWMVLDPKLKTIEESHLQLLDQMIKDKLENRLYLPSDMKSSYDSIKDRIDDIGWPYIKDLYNQFIFVLHPGDYQNLYYDMDQNLESQSMFIGSYGSESYADYASFFIQNDVDLDVIQKLVDDQFIVRTRIDSNLMFSKQRFEDALLSRAQILTTDFSIGRYDLNLEDVIYLDDDEHMITS